MRPCRHRRRRASCEGVAAPVGVLAGDVVRAVAAEDTVAERHFAVVIEIVDAAAIDPGGVAGQSAAADSRGTSVPDGAAVVGGIVAGQGATANAQLARVVDGAAEGLGPG